MTIRLKNPLQVLEQIMHAIGVTAGSDEKREECVDIIRCEMNTWKAHESWLMSQIEDTDKLRRFSVYADMAGKSDDSEWMKRLATEIDKRGVRDSKRGK